MPISLDSLIGKKTLIRNVTEEEILEGCRQNDQKYQYILYKKFAPTMLAVCRRYTSSIQDAEDVLQDGFIKIFNGLKNYRSEGSLEGWIRRIIVNTALNQYRSNLKNMYHVDVKMCDEDLYPITLNYEKLDTKILLKMIESLPNGYKLVFNLYIEGYSHTEIAKMLSISVNTSKSQLFKARKALQKKIEKLSSSENNILRTSVK